MFRANSAARCPTDTDTGTEALTRPCILCGKCLDTCPLFIATDREELSPRGKSMVMRQGLEQKSLQPVSQQSLLDASAARKLLGLCLGCGRCAKVCPQGRNLPELLRKVRADHPGWQSWLWRTWIRRARQLWPFLGRCAGLLPKNIAHGSIEALRTLSRPPQVTGAFRRIARTVEFPRNAVLFPGCTARFVRPWWINNAQKMLGLTGSQLDRCLDWHCCGFTVAQAGLPQLSTEMQSHNVAVWREQGRPILVTLCVTCTAALRGYADSSSPFQSEEERSAWKSAVQPLSALLDCENYRSVGQEAIVYHRPCHVSDPDSDAEFLRNVLAYRLVDQPGRNCCGMGGMMQLSAPQLSRSVASHYWEAMTDQESGIVATGCSGCILQLAATAPQSTAVAHWLELLTE
ncbi:(Fe-S)-binding protein [Desulfonatronum thioautotrophicum]|uniref:(Fe-S)-binding protein n=1 Tax=Desulfonatronum thioautotrophicum TaxID=617001 RepID=UPI00069A39E9|nr:(Fe-S)-binding protein [Desulfonatronum thioautotrophicum]